MCVYSPLQILLILQFVNSTFIPLSEHHHAFSPQPQLTMLIVAGGAFLSGGPLPLSFHDSLIYDIYDS